MNKIKTYLGLCVKSRGLVIGQDSLKKFKKSIDLLVVSPTASQNLIDLAIRLKDKFKCLCIKTNLALEDLVSIEGCKIVGITNSSLAQAILTQTEEFIVLKEK